MNFKQDEELKNNMTNQKFKVEVFATEQQASKFTAEKIFNLVSQKITINLGLATGSTPILTYKYLIEMLLHAPQYDPQNLVKIKTFNLDEYLNLSKEHPQSYHYFMEQQLFQKLPLIQKNNIFFPKENLDYDQLIKDQGGIDLQILGIGTNGHIGFNEPGSSANSKTRVVDLAPSTIEDNSRFFNNIKVVPKQAISMGLATIMQARKIVLLAFGKTKKNAVQKLLSSTKFDPEFPASILTLHPNVEIIVDKAAYKD